MTIKRRILHRFFYSLSFLRLIWPPPISYRDSNTSSTLNSLTVTTRNEWTIFHYETPIRFPFGDQDEFIHGTRREKIRDKFVSLCNGKVVYLSFKGWHALNKELINSLI